LKDFEFVETQGGPMLFGSSPELLVELLTELERLLKRAGSPVERLGAGLAPVKSLEVV